jgi:hypothetical protein
MLTQKETFIMLYVSCPPTDLFYGNSTDLRPSYLSDRTSSFLLPTYNRPSFVLRNILWLEISVNIIGTFGIE